MLAQNVAKTAVSRLYLLSMMNHGTSKMSIAGPSGSGGNANAANPQEIVAKASAMRASFCLKSFTFQRAKSENQ